MRQIFVMYRFKKCVQILQACVKLVITIEKKWMKVEHVQLFYN